MTAKNLQDQPHAMAVDSQRQTGTSADHRSGTPGELDLHRMYANRFAGQADYRHRVWQVLVSFFSRWISPSHSVLEVGAGYCEFINNVGAAIKYAMDLNPSIRERANPDIKVLHQNCCDAWPLSGDSVDCVFTSNFLEHLPDKTAVTTVMREAYRCLKPGGRFIAMGPNIKYVPGAYWDFFDHLVQLTELSVAEALITCDFVIESCTPRFLPYTMSLGRQYPVWMMRLYLSVPAIWPVFGKQFLVVARKPSDPTKAGSLHRNS